LVDPIDNTRKTHDAAVLSDVEALVRPVVEAHRLELFDLSFRLEQGGWVLRVTVDCVVGVPADGVPGGAESGVTLGQCEGVSRDLSTVLDVADLLPPSYTLEVSSPSVERPLRVLADYVRFVGRPAKLTLCASMPGYGSVLRGVLAGVDGASALLDVGGSEPVSVPLSSIKRANLVYELPAKKKKGSSQKKRRSPVGRRD